MSWILTILQRGEKYSTHLRNSHESVRYRATIAASSLKVTESRIIADLLLRGVNGHDWRTELVEKNVLQIQSRETATRWGRLLRARLELM